MGQLLKRVPAWETCRRTTIPLHQPPRHLILTLLYLIASMMTAICPMTPLPMLAALPVDAETGKKVSFFFLFFVSLA
jgi:hypothetical protein